MTAFTDNMLVLKTRKTLFAQEAMAGRRRPADAKTGLSDGFQEQNAHFIHIHVLSSNKKHRLSDNEVTK